MRYRFLLGLLGAGLLASQASAQTPAPGAGFGFVFGNVARIMQGQGSDTLRQAWAGGLNTPQFSAIDFNGDGQADLYAFDRETTRSYTFLSVADVAGPGRHYQYAPDYARIFPDDLQSWVLLRDYDCDGRADLFTYAPGGDIRVFHNVAGAGGVPNFVLVNNQLTFPYGGNTVNLNTGFYNVPAIQDVNGDGRLDIVAHEYISSISLQLFLNTSTGSCGGIGSFDFITNYWGQTLVCPTDCAGFQFNGNRNCHTYRTSHSAGHSALLLDLNGDGKLDLLDGRDNCSQLTRLLNVGSSTIMASFDSLHTTSNFPSAASPASLAVFPTPFSLDVTFDGVPDLLVASAMTDNTQDHVSMRQNVRLYRNTAAKASDVPAYSWLTDSFLQNEMLDVSEGAAPVFGDVDGDGLVDMLVANHADAVANFYRASIYYYRNVGTAHKPAFRLVTDDYLGLAATAALTPTVGFQGLRPQLVDLNRDGALDLVYSVYQFYPPSSTYPGGYGENRLYYILNTASAGHGLALNPATTSYFKSAGAAGSGILPSSQYDAPCFFDVDGDGYVDLLLGTNSVNEPGYSLRYFRNQGAGARSLDYTFALANNDYGALRTGSVFNNGRPINIAPLVADFDQDGKPDLLTVDGGGTVRLYAGFQTQGSTFVDRTNLFYNNLSQKFEPARLGSGSPITLLRFAAAAADLNQDGRPELYVGTETGGVISYLSTTSTALASRGASAQALALGLYPNPASSSATVETAQPTRVRLLDLTGRLVGQQAELARRHELRLQGLAPGVYLVQATAADGTQATQRLAVQ